MANQRHALPCSAVINKLQLLTGSCGVNCLCASESDAGLTFVNPLFAFYEQLLTAMLGAWRSAFGNAKLPFEIVQLPNYSSLYAESVYQRVRVLHWPFVREAQRQVGLC